MTDSRCPVCHSEARRVIYMGFPMLLCSIDDCNCLWGFWSWITAIHFDGNFMEYKGSYLLALRHWLFSDMKVE